MSLNIYEELGLVRRDDEWAEPGKNWPKFANLGDRPFSSRSTECLSALGYLAGEMLVETIGHETIAIEEPEHFAFTLQIFGDALNKPISDEALETFIEAGKTALRDWNATHVIDMSQAGQR